MSYPQQDTVHGEQILKRAASVVPVLIMLLLAGAVIFYKERMLFIDAPHVFFRVVNDGSLHIEEHRYGSFITQMFPLLGSWLHLPFRLLVVLYSASFYLFYLSVSLMLVYRFRSYFLAILFGLYLTVFVSDTFFWPNNEVHQGIAWLFLAFALNTYIASKNYSPIIAFPVFVLSSWLAIWTHPLVMIVAVFLWLFMWLGKLSWPYTIRQSLVYTGILATICYMKFSQGAQHGYDSTKLELITGFHFDQLKAVFSSPQFYFFIKGCVSSYLLFTFIFIAGLVVMLIKRRLVHVLLTIAFAFVYIVLVCIAFKDPNTSRFYIESEYMPLAAICCTPFVFFVLPLERKNGAFWTISIVFVICLSHIYMAAEPFKKRVSLMDDMINKMKAKNLSKVVIAEPASHADNTLIMNWGAPAESMILSRLKGEEPQRTFIFLPPASPFINGTGNDTFLGCWEKRSPAQMNNRYFSIDIMRPYRVMSYEELMK